jgi:N-acetylglucosaminyldiphosphoundecaprenol N-acetyl-beta-D-mannosaminyltransferase
MNKHPEFHSTAHPSSIVLCNDADRAVVRLCSHDYADVLGVKVSAVNMGRAAELADQWVEASHPGYVCVTGVHGVMEAQRDPELREILNHAVMNTPDGMPMSWVGWLQGFSDMGRVFGPDFMLAMCQLSLDRGYRHFLYGSAPGVAEQLQDALKKKFRGLQIVGTYTPPFRSLTSEEESALLFQVHNAKPHIMWIGLSTPKQERFMAQYVDHLQVPLLVGVGAAFDFHTGDIRDCSPWVKRAGLQWLHRLLQDPRRLWRRYLRSNPAFVWNIALQLVKLRRHSNVSPPSTPHTQPTATQT